MGSDTPPGTSGAPFRPGAAVPAGAEGAGPRPILTPPPPPPARVAAPPEPVPADLPRWAGPPARSRGFRRPPARGFRRPPSRGWRRAPKRRSAQQKLLLLAIGVVAVFGGLAIAAATWLTLRVDDAVDRIADPFPSGERPAPSASGTTFLVVGVDTATGETRDSLAGSLMLLRITGDRSDAQVVSLPVFAQAQPGGPALDELFGAGGPPQLIGAVEDLSGLRIDHYAELDFAGFSTVTDALGGVTVDVPEAYSNQGLEFPAGRQHLDGAAALAFVRDSGSAAEASSAERQQVMVEAVFDRVSRLGLLSDAGRLTETMQSLASALKVDETLNNAALLRLASSLGNVSQPEFLTAPTSQTSVQDGRTTATFDPARADKLWEYLREDTLGQHLDEFR